METITTETILDFVIIKDIIPSEHCSLVKGKSTLRQELEYIA